RGHRHGRAARLRGPASPSLQGAASQTRRSGNVSSGADGSSLSLKQRSFDATAGVMNPPMNDGLKAQGFPTQRPQLSEAAQIHLAGENSQKRRQPRPTLSI